MPQTVTATTNAATARAIITVTWTGVTPVPAVATVQRVNEDGTVVPVRGADPAALVAGQWIGDDYEAPLDASFYYQATSTDAPGVTLTSPLYSLSSQGDTWLKHPGRPAMNMRLTIRRGPDWEREAVQGLFPVLGRSRPVAVGMVRGSRTGDLEVGTATETQRSALLGLLADGDTLFLSTPAGYGVGSMYVSVGSVTEARVTGYGKAEERIFTLPLTEVDRPPGGALAVGNTWGDVLTRYPSWQQALTTEGTWAGILEGVDG